MVGYFSNYLYSNIAYVAGVDMPYRFFSVQIPAGSRICQRYPDPKPKR
jgi:hypothetical protein